MSDEVVDAAERFGHPGYVVPMLLSELEEPPEQTRSPLIYPEGFYPSLGIVLALCLGRDMKFIRANFPQHAITGERDEARFHAQAKALAEQFPELVRHIIRRRK